MMKLYGDRRSGNCYKVYLLCALLEQPYQWVDVDILAKQTQEDAFLTKNANGKIPIIELPSGQTLAESNAILHYLADGTTWLPQDKMQRAQVLQWQFFEQYSHEPYIAVARFINLYLKRPADREADYQAKLAPGYKALTVMQQHLQQHAFFVGEQPTIADISLYAYTHVAHEAAMDLSGYPAILRWLDRMKDLPHYVSMS